MEKNKEIQDVDIKAALDYIASKGGRIMFDTTDPFTPADADYDLDSDQSGVDMDSIGNVETLDDKNDDVDFDVVIPDSEEAIPEDEVVASPTGKVKYGNEVSLTGCIASHYMSLMAYLLDIKKDDGPINWHNQQKKYYIGHNAKKGFHVCSVTAHRSAGTIYFARKDLIEHALELFKDDLEELFELLEAENDLTETRKSMEA